MTEVSGYNCDVNKICNESRIYKNLWLWEKVMSANNFGVNKICNVIVICTYHKAWVDGQTHFCNI